MGKITQLGDLKNQNHCKIIILEIEIITNYEFLKSKSSLNKVILRIILKITFELLVFFLLYAIVSFSNS